MVFSNKESSLRRLVLYPMYHWYDVLGLIPLLSLDFSDYSRRINVYFVKNSNLTNVGNDIFTRTFTYYTNIIKEELTDMVTVRILSEMQEEIKSGASINLVPLHGSKTRAIKN